jgi:hypothetical protein
MNNYALNLEKLDWWMDFCYKHDPAIVTVMLTNENDVTHHLATAYCLTKAFQIITRDMTQANLFAKKFGLPFDKVWHLWEPGPSKLFLNDLEHRFQVEMIKLRSLGVKIPIVTTSSWGRDSADDWQSY